MKGYFNRLLRINLYSQTYKYEELSDTLLGQTIGGKGLGAHLLAHENPVGVDPLNPENVFIITTGPVTGTRMWSQSRFAVFSKSPATGGYGESYCGGRLAPKIKGCGVDTIIIEGRCNTLSFLAIDEDGVIFHRADNIKGRDTFGSEDYILKHSKAGAGAMVIGPAGENLVCFACIKSDRWRSLGRGGMGAVLGSKNIKGISFAGKKTAGIADDNLLKSVMRQVSQKAKNSPITEVYKKYGTPSQVRVTNSQNCFPTKYWYSGHFEHWENLSADYIDEHFEVKNHGCPNCFLQCTKKTRVLSGKHRGLEIEGPEYETIFAIGGLNCIDSLEDVIFLNDLCDRLGLDTISAGNISALMIEAHKRGKTDFKIDYNQPKRMAELFEIISRREKLGNILANGIKAASMQLGIEDIAIHVKGLEPAGFDPRVLKGMGLSYATSARGACHLRGTFYKAELSGQIAKDQIAGKAELVIDYEDRAALFDSLILCRFFRDFILWDELSMIIEASTGMVFSKKELEITANRITQATRAYNLREGLSASTDTLPERFLNEKAAQGASLTQHELDTMISDYNVIRKKRDK